MKYIVIIIMKYFAILTLVALLMAGCGHRDPNQFDTNAAELNESPGDVGRSNSETNAQAEARAHGAGIVAVQSTGKLTGDESFAAAAAEAGLAEVYLGELAETKNKNKDLLDFAIMMIKDHSAANEELKNLAAQKGLQLPTECTDCKGTYHELHDMVGTDFEKRYATTMVHDHEQAVALFQKESESGKDPELKAWAAKKLPTLRHHLEMARDLAKKTSVEETTPTASQEKASKQDEAPRSKKELRKEKKAARKAKQSKG